MAVGFLSERRSLLGLKVHSTVNLAARIHFF